MAYITFNDGLTTLTVAAPGAAAGATSIPLTAALTVRLLGGTVLTFSSGHTATCAGTSLVGATSIAVTALASAIATGETTTAALTLNNDKALVGQRFANWTPLTKPIGDTATRQSDGALSVFVYRTDYGASFELPYIPVKLSSFSERLTDYADRLAAWLMRGGICTIYTEDTDGSTYPTCGLMPGTTPSLTLTDRVNLEYTLRLSLINLAASPVRMVCHYV